MGERIRGWCILRCIFKKHLNCVRIGNPTSITYTTLPGYESGHNRALYGEGVVGGRWVGRILGHKPVPISSISVFT